VQFVIVSPAAVSLYATQLNNDTQNPHLDIVMSSNNRRATYFQQIRCYIVHTYFIIGILKFWGQKKEHLVKAKLVIASLFNFAPEWVRLLHFSPSSVLLRQQNV